MIDLGITLSITGVLIFGFGMITAVAMMKSSLLYRANNKETISLQGKYYHIVPCYANNPPQPELCNNCPTQKVDFIDEQEY